MLLKTFAITFSICLIGYLAQSQENKLLLSFKDNTSKVIEKGDYVRLSYPTSKLDIKQSAKTPKLLGFRGKVDSVTLNQIWLRIDKRTAKIKIFTVEDILAIKKVSKSSEFLTFLGTYVLIGGAAVAGTSIADLNSGVVVFAGAFSLFPAAILTANVFYPSKPRRKVGGDYTIKVVTIN